MSLLVSGFASDLKDETIASQFAAFSVEMPVKYAGNSPMKYHGNFQVFYHGIWALPQLSIFHILYNPLQSAANSGGKFSLQAN